jgi:hypothetical protein
MAQQLIDDNSVFCFVDDNSISAFVDDVANFLSCTPPSPPPPPGAGAVAGVVSYDVAVVSGRRVVSYE